MTKTEKANGILLAIYEELKDGDLYEETGKIVKWVERMPLRKHKFSVKLAEIVPDYYEFCKLMVQLLDNGFIKTKKILEEELIRSNHIKFLNVDYSYNFYEIQITELGVEKCKELMEENKKTKEEKANQILLAIYEENNENIYDKIPKIDATWRGGIFKDVYEDILKTHEQVGYVVVEYEAPEKHEGFKGFFNVVLTEKGIEKCVQLSGKEKIVKKLDMTQVFIVHGHDGEAKTEAARFVEKLGFEAIILHEQTSLSKTIIEKIEHYSDVGFGIVLYTSCDLGATKSEEANLKPRARQNVVFEHGYLMGKIGRSNVCALVKGDVETPSDISGVVYIPMDDYGAWRGKIADEMKAAGYDVDKNKIKS